MNIPAPATAPSASATDAPASGDSTRRRNISGAPFPNDNSVAPATSSDNLNADAMFFNAGTKNRSAVTASAPKTPANAAARASARVPLQRAVVRLEIRYKIFIARTQWILSHVRAPLRFRRLARAHDAYRLGSTVGGVPALASESSANAPTATRTTTRATLVTVVVIFRARMTASVDARGRVTRRQYPTRSLE